MISLQLCKSLSRRRKSNLTPGLRKRLWLSLPNWDVCAWGDYLKARVPAILSSDFSASSQPYSVLYRPSSAQLSSLVSLESPAKVSDPWALRLLYACADSASGPNYSSGKLDPDALLLCLSLYLRSIRETSIQIFLLQFETASWRKESEGGREGELKW